MIPFLRMDGEHRLERTRARARYACEKCDSVDEMASFLAPYENAEAVKIARGLDAKVKRLLESAS